MMVVKSQTKISERDVYTARLRSMDANVGFPSLSYALMSMTPIITSQVPTAACDKYWRLYVNPTFFAGLNAEEGSMVLVHEVWHPLSEHFRRATIYGIRPEETHIWNIATDLEINTKDKLYEKLPKGCLHPAKSFKEPLPINLMAEEYFPLLLKLSKEELDKFNSSIGRGCCGSCADGIAKDYELPPPNGSDIPGIDQTRGKMIINETARSIIEHANKGIGNVSAGWLRWANKILKPQVEWRKYLRPALYGMLSSVVDKTIPTYRSMSRRQFKYPDFIMPHHVGVIPHVAVIIDTSGSMSDDYLSQGRAEVDGILQSAGSRIVVDVYATDAAAAEAQRISCTDSMKLYGGGGTDMREGFKAIEEEARRDANTRPSLIVVITDGLTPWPEEAPGYAQVCVVLIGHDGDAPGWAKPPNHVTVTINSGPEDPLDDAD